MNKNLLRPLVATLVGCGLFLISTPVHAQPITILLVRNGALINVDDSAGRWQHDGGDVTLDGLLVGHFARTKRVTFTGTSPQNTAMLTITVFILIGDPPENCTFEGSHSFNSGGEIGSISACSAGFAAEIGRTFSSPDGTTFTIN